MDYEKEDEFGRVCADFEEMRAYLKESVEQRLLDEKRRKELITGISHDLRTPLTSISGYVDGLIDGIADTPEKQMRYFQAIKTRTGNMVSLAESLSEYCRLDSSHFRYHLEPADLKVFIKNYLKSCRQEAEEQHVEIDFIYEKEAYPVLIDQKELERVFDNLFANTVRYRMEEPSHVCIMLNKSPEGTVVEIVFGDDGPGVPKESLERIFDSFYRVDDSRKEAGKGSGIGLAVVKEIILGHGGSVTAQNREGLTILIQLPLRNSPADGKETQ